MGVQKKPYRKCANPKCGRVKLVSEGVEHRSGRYFCSRACAPLKLEHKKGSAAGLAVEGQEVRVAYYAARFAAGLPLFEERRKRKGA